MKRGRTVVFEDAALPAAPKASFSEQSASAPSSRQIQDARRSLPIFTYRSRILSEFERSRVLIIVGETGCGKTTQIPQYLFESAHRKGWIGVTQPRRVAAITISRRVAEEMGTSVGERVGYCVRFDENVTPRTRIKFVTDGMLLREGMIDPLLSKYSVVIIDEAHERSLQTDILLGVIKLLLSRRPDLKIIVMSATLQIKLFSSFFPEAAVLHIEGRTYPVEVFYTHTPEPDYLDAALNTVLQIHHTEKKGDILVFLTGQEEILILQTLLQSRMDSLKTDVLLSVHVIFAALPHDQQLMVFNPAPKGTRKVILSTNIAESSITISGIRYVVDTGLVKVRGFHSVTGVDCLLVIPESQSQAWQRSGRAGREAPGKCYRLFTEGSFLGLREDAIPEIKRCNMCSVILQLKTMDLDVFTFPFLEPPSQDALQKSLEILYYLQALDPRGGITALGRELSMFPLDPIQSNVIIKAKAYHCLRDVRLPVDPACVQIITIIALLSVDSIFFIPKGKESESKVEPLLSLLRDQNARMKFASADGDHLTLLNVYTAYQYGSTHSSTDRDVKGDFQWCRAHFLNTRALQTAGKVIAQLTEYCESQKYPIETCGPDHQNILKCFVAGGFLKIATKQLQISGSTRSQYKTVFKKQLASIHPSSVLFAAKNPADFIFYDDLVFTNKNYLRCISAISPEWYYDLVPATMQSVPIEATNSVDCSPFVPPDDDEFFMKCKNLLEAYRSGDSRAVAFLNRQGLATPASRANQSRDSQGVRDFMREFRGRF